MAALGADHSKYNVAVAYGDRTSFTKGSYDDASAAGAVAAFLLMRGPHWLFALEPTSTLNLTTAHLVTSDYGQPLGNLTAVAGHPNVFQREYEKATVQLDCNGFHGTFHEKTTTATK
jgi:hypothetical protein